MSADNNATPIRAPYGGFTDADGRPVPGSPAASPCPFCGGPDLVLQPTRAAWCVHCEQCGGQGPEGDSALKAAQAWNARANEVRS